MVTPTMAERRSICRVLLQLLRNITLAALFYGLLFSIISLTSGPSKPRGKLGIPATLNKAGPADIIKVWKTGVRVKFAGSTQAVTINPHANVFNRQDSCRRTERCVLGFSSTCRHRGRPEFAH